MPARGTALHNLAPLDAPTTATGVQDALVAMIEATGLGVGDRLPPEVALAARLGVGRSTIREAMNRWEGLGIIRRRRGDGTYLTAQVRSSAGPLPTMIGLEGEALLRILQVRRDLEAGSARRAALAATPAQRHEIDTLCDRLLVVVASGEPYHAPDMAFHTAICDATGNPMYRQILHHLDQAFARSDDTPFSPRAFGIASFPFHRDLADAIIAADPEGAVAAIHTIIDSVADELRQIIDHGRG